MHQRVNERKVGTCRKHTLWTTPCLTKCIPLCLQINPINFSQPLKALGSYQLMLGVAQQIADSHNCITALCQSASILIDLGAPEHAMVFLAICGNLKLYLLFCFVFSSHGIFIFSLCIMPCDLGLLLLDSARRGREVSRDAIHDWRTFNFVSLCASVESSVLL